MPARMRAVARRERRLAVVARAANSRPCSWSPRCRRTPSRLVAFQRCRRPRSIGSRTLPAASCDDLAGRRLAERRQRVGPHLDLAQLGCRAARADRGSRRREGFAGIVPEQQDGADGAQLANRCRATIWSAIAPGSRPMLMPLATSSTAVATSVVSLIALFSASSRYARLSAAASARCAPRAWRDAASGARSSAPAAPAAAPHLASMAGARRGRPRPASPCATQPAAGHGQRRQRPASSAGAAPRSAEAITATPRPTRSATASGAAGGSASVGDAGRAAAPPARGVSESHASSGSIVGANDRPPPPVSAAPASRAGMPPFRFERELHLRGERDQRQARSSSQRQAAERRVRGAGGATRCRASLARLRSATGAGTSRTRIAAGLQRSASRRVIGPRLAIARRVVELRGACHGDRAGAATHGARRVARNVSESRAS